jgi:predicted anti-sigma-YlaC factor YlaD
MTKHYSEADLLETYYTQPGESMPVMMHLASCPDCAARYERLDRKLREAAVCHTERPATFWSRQRLSIMRKVEAVRASRAGQRVRPWRVAAAAVLAFLLGGAVVYKTVEPQLHKAPVVVAQPAVTSAPATGDDEELQNVPDPWESDELQEFHGVVQWESWVAQANSPSGDASL